MTSQLSLSLTSLASSRKHHIILSLQVNRCTFLHHHHRISVYGVLFIFEFNIYERVPLSHNKILGVQDRTSKVLQNCTNILVCSARALCLTYVHEILHSQINAIMLKHPALLTLPTSNSYISPAYYPQRGSTTIRNKGPVVRTAAGAETARNCPSGSSRHQE